MKCLDCGGKMSSSRESYRDKASGLSHVTMLGVEVRRCATCGEYEVVLPKVEGLNLAIAGALIAKSSRLTAEEVRFLRKLLGWTGVELARHLGVSAESVSRWENGREIIGAVPDRLARLVVALKTGLGFELGALSSIATKPSPSRVTLAYGPHGWRIASAPATTRTKRKAA